MNRFACAAGLICSLVVSGCAGSSGLSSSLPHALVADRAYGRSAASAKDGAYPNGGLIVVNGTLYGTTSHGGACTRYGGECGTVYKIDRAGERVLHVFDAKRDGSMPSSGLVDVNGTLYGTTPFGGSGTCPGGCGTIYAISTTGAERVLHRFKGPDGARPYASLIAVNGTLYGTTSDGGVDDEGIVFSITTTGVEHVLYSFKGRRDGASPSTALTYAFGKLYGTTFGTIYRANVNGGLRALSSNSIGANGLLYWDGTLYGTASSGGDGWGTVYSMTQTGSRQRLYAFTSLASGGPNAALIAANGTLYGTTSPGAGRFGTVFSVSTAGAEHVVYRFKGGADGSGPAGPLTYANGVFYGTTGGGGADGRGTVFTLSPSGTERVLYSFKG